MVGRRAATYPAISRRGDSPRDRRALPALDLVLAHDESGSISRAGAGHLAAMSLEAARLAVALLLALDASTRIAYVGFSGADRSRELPLARLNTERDHRKVVSRIEAATFETGWTDYGSALRSVIDVLADGDAAYGWPPYRVEGRTVAVLFLSDGLPAADPHRVPDREQLRELRADGGVYQRLAERRWPVFTVGIGRAARHPDAATILDDMARATRGRSVVAATVEELLAAYVAVIAELGGQRWTPCDPAAPAPVVRRFELRPGLRRATFAAVRSHTSQSLLVVDPGGNVVDGAIRVAAARFENVTIADPCAGLWSATVVGAGQASIGLLTSGGAEPAEQGGADRE
jgi:von Willebrand factor type A domain-containing protein